MKVEKLMSIARDVGNIKTSNNSKHENITSKLKKRIKQNRNTISTHNVDQLTRFHDEEFIINAYNSILGRDVDPEAFLFYINKLRSNQTNKLSIISSLKNSEEGKLRNIKITGLKRKIILQKLYRLPVIGYFIRWVIILVKLPRLANHIHGLDRHINSKFSEISSNIDVIMSEHYEAQESILNDLHNKVDKGEEFIYLLDEYNKFKTKSSSNKFKDLYLSFEDKFRGSVEEIKQRQSIYLPYLEYLPRDGKILDIGSGRGEWLELLKDNNYTYAYGIDSNEDMVTVGRLGGLNVILTDALTHLRTLNDNSLAAITGFHIVEHFPFESLVELFDECLRVLTPGGIIIFETPNPENLIVGSCNFYNDPSHYTPIPPISLQFYAQNRGFSNVEIKRLHPIKNITDNMTEIEKRFYWPQDYSIIGYK